MAPRIPHMPSGDGKNKSPKPPVKPPVKREWLSNIATALLLFLLLVTAYSIISEGQDKQEPLPLSELAQKVREGEVKEIIVEGEDLEVTLADDSERVSQKEAETGLAETLSVYGVSAQQLQQVKIVVQDKSGFGYWLVTILPFLIPVLFFLVIIWILMRQVKGAGVQAFSFGQSKARIIDPEDQNQRVKFKDVAGAKEAKEELKEVVDFLRNPKKFIDIGARIPKGVILMGAPGTGKTLLARAVAGEARVPFFHLSGSEFVEMFVGVGASRVRDLFKLAKKAAPAIIFIDEIDAVGRTRGVGLGGGNDEREQTLNQILVEMDGFEPNEKVIIMAATNRPDVLDPALLRTGRFDRRVTLDLPDRGDREEILKTHARKKPLAKDVSLRVIAERTPGFSGADLYSLMNEGAILAARENRKEIAQYDLIRSIEKVMLGPERKSHVLTQQEKEIVAYHEGGHALVSSVLPHADPVHKVTIVSRGHAGGYTLKLPTEERRLQSKKEFLDDLAVSLGGFVAEEMLFKDITTGPSNDLAVATALARDMVTKYGMSDEVGPLALETSGGRVLMGARQQGADYSEEAAALVDREVKKLMTEALSRAKTVLKKHRKALDAIARRLIEVEVLERDEYEKILAQHNIPLKGKKGSESGEKKEKDKKES